MDGKFQDDPFFAEYQVKRRLVTNEKIQRCRQFKEMVMRGDKTSYLQYRQNTPKEQLVLQHVIQYKKQFQEHINQGNQVRELFLYPKNQCEVYKFICTTIRPTKLGFLELHNYVDCAKKISKFIQYQELSPPDQFPKCIPSPANVANWQKGDCFDMSILLTSLLIGVGYDAYCVYGIAPKQITTKNQALMECPFLDELRQASTMKAEIQEKNDKEESNIPVRIVQSAFQRNQLEQQRLEREELAKKALTIDDDEPDQLNPDLFLGRRVHCWVLLKAGKMGVTQDKFIEPSTGTIYDIKKSPYLLVDAVFNNQNFFIQMQPKHKVDQINFKLYDSMSWQYIMYHDDIFRNISEDQHHQIDDGSANKMSDQDQKLKFIAQTLDMPPPWSPKIYIDKDAYLRGTRLGEQTTFFIKVKVQKYSDYNQSDGLVTKYTLFDDYKKIKIKEIGYIYNHRTDKLQRKYRYPYEFKTIELYGPGKMPHWKEVTEIDRRLRRITYYPNRNHDGLIERIEKIGEQTIQKYQNRDDRIILRSCTFVRKGASEKLSTNKNYEYPDHHVGKVLILKITQKFEKDDKKPPHEQIAKFSVDFVKDKVTVFYHMEDGEIEPIKREHSRDEIQGFGKLDNNQHNPKDPLIEQENQKLLAMEKDFYQFIKAEEIIASDQYKNIRNEPPKVEKTLYDKARDKFKENKNKVEDEINEQDANDFLKPFLEKMGENTSKDNVLDPDKAAKVKAEVMNKMKERIKERAKIIQARLQKQQDQLKSLQEQYQKKQEEKNQTELSDIKFKIGILENRASRFEATALNKFQQMDKKLDADPRLARLKQKK